MKKMLLVIMLVVGLVVMGNNAMADMYGSGGTVFAGSVSGTGSIIGDISNGAIAGSGALACSYGDSYRHSIKAKAFTESFSFTYHETGVNWNADLKGREEYTLTEGYTESKAKADVKKLSGYGCGRGMYEHNFVAVAGLSGATSSIGNMNQGAGGLAGGAYVAVAIGNDAVMAQGHSDSLTTSWIGSNNNAQWSGAYSTNTTVAQVNVSSSHGYGN